MKNATKKHQHCPTAKINLYFPLNTHQDVCHIHQDVLNIHQVHYDHLPSPPLTREHGSSHAWLALSPSHIVTSIYIKMTIMGKSFRVVSTSTHINKGTSMGHIRVHFKAPCVKMEGNGAILECRITVCN